MNSNRLKQHLLSNAQEIRRLHARVHETARLRDRSELDKQAWQSACSDFHARYDALAFPGGCATALARIEASDTNAVEAALCFLEARPYFFRSGYLYKDILRKLKNAALSKGQTQRLATIAVEYERYRANARRRSRPNTSS